ncbi:SseB family protein [Elusimicrobium minutum Pei191]|uniref:SseB family protein n=1 Tax=Elusimicrobium minutum (strain Pei191) TaxID=445932 RepID=B2KD31_ELUMP|nr:enhanced serine sensitivity protein SseB C-terminal domain-containing protein [Elusimicrobium minutum]ACC98427.1 SseB family protein [Elusimicrobium minutum Pei191]
MGIFNFLKKKPIQPDLYEALKKAASDPIYQGTFYDLLLEAMLIVIYPKEDGTDRKTFQKGDKIAFIAFNDGKIPIFTSKERIFDNNVVKEKQNIYEIKGRDLFENAKGATFVLNPYSDHGKFLLPNEIESILSEQPRPGLSKQIKIDNPMKVLIGAPAKYPHDMLNALKDLFSTKLEVEAAYIGWIFNPATKEPPHYIFCIEAKGDIKPLTNEAGYIVSKFIGKSEFVDFIQKDGKAVLLDYFNTIEPFYKK